MFAIIDIETCGGRFEFKRGRITEICILKHDGLSVIEKFSTLINPECYISPYFTGLTGITNDMVRDAPKFFEIAPKIIEITEGCIFVAHNVGFDYGFVRDEFKSLGYTFKRDTLCTVRLSRKLIPNRISYSLGHLCASLGIEIFGRHRAEGDAVATAQLFDLLIRLKSQHPQYKNMSVENIMTRRVDKIKQYILNKLPEECGVYYFRNKENEIIYIGKSNNMYHRAQSHFNSDLRKSKKMLHELINADFELAGSELIALLLEAEEIKNHKPKFNRSRKADVFTHSIVYFEDNKKILNLKIEEYNEKIPALVSFNNFSSAHERLESWIDEYELCLRYCGLVSEDAVCFNHQIKKCRGLCADMEEIDEYNRRVKKIISEYDYPHENFLLLDKGRNENEISVIMIENNRYFGYGYYNKVEIISNYGDLKSSVKKKKYFPDSDLLIRKYLNRNNNLKIVEVKNQEYQN